MLKYIQKIKAVRFSDNFIGALWLTGAVVLFQISYSVVKITGEKLGTFQIVFLRAMFQSLILLPLVLKAGIGIMKTKQYKNYFFRLSFGITNIVLTFFAYTHMNLAAATSIVFTRPLFSIPLAAVMLKEKAGWARGIATLVGFGGVLVVLDPEHSGFGLPEMSALGASFALAITYIYIQKLSRTENHLAMLMYFGLASFAASAWPAYCQWVPFGLKTLVCLFVIAATATAAQYCIIRGYQIGKTTVISPVDYLQIPLSALIGWCFFNETLSLHFAVGVIIIVTTSVYILKRRAGE